MAGETEEAEKMGSEIRGGSRAIGIAQEVHTFRTRGQLMTPE